MTSTASAALSAQLKLQELLTEHGTQATLPAARSIQEATQKIITKLPTNGLGLESTAAHLLHDITPGLNRSSLSPNYYGFVTGGHTPISLFADHIVSTWDQNVSVHLPNESLATTLEERALVMLCQLFDLSPEVFSARTLTTGATASNILGLAAGREWLLRSFSRKAGVQYETGQGLLASCLAAGIRKIRVLTTVPHSSLGKAANIVGLGSGNLIDVSVRNADGSSGVRFDLQRLETLLSEPGTASIVAVSCSEVNLGAFATSSRAEIQQLRDLCDTYSAWMHVDAAFGLFATLLPDTPPYQLLRQSVAGLDLADSLTSDGHKLLNVPYDTGFFFSRHSDISAAVFSNPNAPYLVSTATDGIQSPLNLGLENSRRWRALPVYATLLAHGRQGYSEMITCMVSLARGIASYVTQCEWLELVQISGSEGGKGRIGSGDEHEQLDGKVDLESIFIVVAVRERDAHRNQSLVQRIKDDGRVYVSGTVIGGIPAARFAVAKWDVDVERDLRLVKEVLEAVGPVPSTA